MVNVTYIAFITMYFIVMLAVGVFSRRYGGSADNFFVADRKASTTLITGSLIATIVGGSATIGMAGMGFSWGLTGIWWLLTGSIGLVILGVFLAKRLRSTGYYTLPQLAESQYGRNVSIIISILIVVAWIGVIAGQIVAAGRIITIISNGNNTLWMVVFTGVFICYTIIGGQRANLRTDFFQSIIIFAGIVTAFTLVIYKVEGLSGLRTMLPEDHFSFPVSNNFGPYQLISWLLLFGMTYVIGPDMFTRMFSAKNQKVARNSALLTAVLIIPFAFCIVILGMSARVLFPEISSAETALPLLIKEQLPLPVGGLVLAALVGAMMSSADTCLVSTSAILSNNIAKKIRPSLSDLKVVRIARLAIVVIGILALWLALRLDSVINSLMFAYTVYAGGVVIPVFAGFYREKLKLTPSGAIAAIGGGGAAAIIGKLCEVRFLDLGALGISAGLLFIVSYIDRKRRPIG